MTPPPPRRAEGHGYGFPPGFDTKPWVVQFNRSPKPPLALISPFDGRRRPYHLDVPELRGGRTCVGQDGDWFLMRDEGTGWCSRVRFSGLSSSQVPLPPLQKSFNLPRLMDPGVKFSDYIVESCGDIFLIRLHLFGSPRVVVNLDACRWNPSRDDWEIVETIGGRTIFLGSKSSFAVSSATRAGTEPNCVHILMRSGYHGFVIYTVSLEDMTIRLNVLEGCNKDLEAFWFVPSRLKQGPSTEFVERKETNQKIEQGKRMNSVLPSKGLGSSNESSQWSDLHTDLVELLVPKISFIDVLHLRAVCKQWSSISSAAIQHAKVFPLLMSTCPRRKDSLDFFDPVSKRKYTIILNIPDDEDCKRSQMLWYSKNGWIIVSRGRRSLYLVNPFKRSPDGVIILPLLDSYGIKGVSFSSVPGSADFLVITVQINAIGTLVRVKTWRPGDKDWTENVFNNGIPFIMACHNPVFFQGNFYCLDINGRIGVFKPDTSEWSVLEKPVAIRSSDGMLSSECSYSYLAEWNGALIAIFRADSVKQGAIMMYKLDRLQMRWSKLDGLKDAVVFWDRKSALVGPPPEEEFCNKMFLPNYAEKDGGRAPTFYCFERRRYYPSFYGHKEPINALWFEPNLEGFQ
ncbi:unnamed protein product [Urochloa decumbens]|uniref:KIB1-4 beta-propeller domain-containing protein n=1 Tax=Urochloa decumbens TaxID=240449 RepID=A0ABC9C2V3_9POAL